MMSIYPESFYTDIEFDQVLEMAAGMAKGSIARNMILGSRPIMEFNFWKSSLNTTRELTQLKREGQSLSLGEYADISSALGHLEIENYVLDIEEVLGVWQVLSLLSGLRQWGRKKDIRPSIIYQNYIAHIDPVLEKITTDLNRVFTPDGSVREDASPELKKLHRQLNSQEKNIAAAFQQVMQKYRTRNLLAEPYESFKNGKRVLCVATENKRNVKGLIQDESTSGQTVYIEPDEMAPLYHDLFQIKSDIRREINRLIRQISDQLRGSLFECREGFMILSACDVWNARANLAMEMDGHMPQLEEKPGLSWYQAYHPILKWRNSQLGRMTVPFDLELTPDQRMVLVSGPNAGGKSVLLKAVALNQVMVQSGFLIPVDPRSHCGMFREFFADIGDQQSLEEDLSTYSSHLKNMRIFLEKSGSQSLVLIDEMGSGTDPQYGGAIAEGVLEKLIRRKVWGVITTHYFNLKMYADKSQRIQNAAMSFDKKHLEPTYRFLPGKPGSSFAFEIARKTGLDQDVIRYAREKSGKNKWAIEEMLVNLENEKHQLVRKETELEKAKKDLNQLMKSNKALSDELTFQRKKWKKERTQMALQQAEEGRRLLQEKIKELGQKDSVTIARKMEAETRKEKTKLSSQIQELDEDLTKLEKIPVDFFKNLKVGDFVRYKDGSVIGKIRNVTKNQAELEVGAIRMSVKKRDLRPAKEPLNIRKGKSVEMQLMDKPAAFDHKIDIRGYTIPEAEKELEQFFDEATIANVSELRILHGKGSGALRNLVRNKLREYQHVREVSHPPREQGGDGITLVKF